MEEQWIVDRGKLRTEWLEHPEWSKRQLAEAVGHSKFWVKKWLKRKSRSTAGVFSCPEAPSAPDRTGSCDTDSGDPG
jgi:hypothetical protein